MKLNSAHLEAFFAIAKVNNFTKAARLLNVTQSALSQRIAKLEEELETTLFVRDRALLRLTEAGEQVLRFCQLNEHAESDLLARLKDSKDDYAGVLRIGGFSSVNRSLVMPALKDLMRKNPRLSIQIFTKELRELDRLLKSAEADYVLTNKKSDSSEFESVFMGFEDNVMVDSRKGSPDGVYLDHDENDPTTRSFWSQNKIDPGRVTMRYLDDVYGLVDGVKNGFGKAVLPLHLIEGEKDLVVIEPRRRLVVPVFMNFFAQPYYKKVHTEFLSAMNGYFHQHLRSR